MFKSLRNLFAKKPKDIVPVSTPWNWETDNPEEFKKSKLLFDMVVKNLDKYPPTQWEFDAVGRFWHHRCLRYRILRGFTGLMLDGVSTYLIIPHADELHDIFEGEIDREEKRKKVLKRQELLEMAKDELSR